MWVDTYLDLALLPDVEGLAELVLGRIATQGALPVYERLLQPALEEVGRRWEDDELTVADEHLVTALTEQVLTRVRRRVTSGPRAVVACTSGNEHRIGAMMVTDTLGSVGWNPILLGAGHRSPISRHFVMPAVCGSSPCRSGSRKNSACSAPSSNASGSVSARTCTSSLVEGRCVVGRAGTHRSA